jgi:hypothetical protein
MDKRYFIFGRHIAVMFQKQIAGAGTAKNNRRQKK